MHRKVWYMEQCLPRRVPLSIFYRLCQKLILLDFSPRLMFILLFLVLVLNNLFHLLCRSLNLPKIVQLMSMFFRRSVQELYDRSKMKMIILHFRFSHLWVVELFYSFSLHFFFIFYFFWNSWKLPSIDLRIELNF